MAVERKKDEKREKVNDYSGIANRLIIDTQTKSLNNYVVSMIGY